MDQENLLPLDHLPRDLLPVFYGQYDVPEIRVFAGVDRRFKKMITGDADFIGGYNLRVNPPVWLWNHTITPEYDRYGLLYGHCVSDNNNYNRRLTIPINPKVNCGVFEFIDFVDVSGSLTLFRLTPIHKLLIYNPFGHRDHLVDLPVLMFPPDSFEIPHHFSITSVPQHNSFRILYVKVVNNVPEFYVFNSLVGTWEVRAGHLVDGEEVGGGVGLGGVVVGDPLTSEFSLMDNGLLYSMSFGDSSRPLYSVQNIVPLGVVEGQDIVRTWYYFGDWALQLRSVAGGRRRVLDLNLYHKNTILGDFLLVAPVPNLQHVMIPDDLETNLSAKVFDGVLYIQMQIFQFRAHPYPHNDFLVNRISRYNIHQLTWLPSITFPFSPYDDTYEGLGHPSPTFASRLTLPMPRQNEV